jgi:hypothetical protein
VKKSLLFVCFLTLCDLSLFAQTETHSRIVRTTEGSSVHVPAQEPPADLQKIYSNLGSSKTDLYDDQVGFAMAGPNAEGEFTPDTFWAMQFTPTDDSHVTQVRVGVQYSGSGANQVNISIYGDTNGLPGTLLAGPVTVKDLPDWPSCCALAVAKFSPLAVTSGTQYWVVANTPASGTGSDFTGVWTLVVQGKNPSHAIYDAGTWGPQPGLAIPSGEVLGTIP